MFARHKHIAMPRSSTHRCFHTQPQSFQSSCTHPHIWDSPVNLAIFANHYNSFTSNPEQYPSPSDTQEGRKPISLPAAANPTVRKYTQPSYPLSTPSHHQCPTKPLRPPPIFDSQIPQCYFRKFRVHKKDLQWKETANPFSWCLGRGLRAGWSKQGLLHALISAGVLPSAFL